MTTNLKSKSIKSKLKLVKFYIREIIEKTVIIVVEKFVDKVTEHFFTLSPG